jgi:hypothetical protein
MGRCDLRRPCCVEGGFEGACWRGLGPLARWGVCPMGRRWASWAGVEHLGNNTELSPRFHMRNFFIYLFFHDFAKIYSPLQI